MTTSTTVRRLITQALKRINVIQPTQTPEADMMADGFDRFNDLVDSICGNDRLLIYSITRTVFTLTSGKGNPSNPYTIGVGGDVNIVRPQYIDHLNYQDISLTTPLELPIVLLTDDAWASVPMKTLTSTLPTYGYYNPTYATGRGSLNLWLVPTRTLLQGVLYWPAQVTSFDSVDDTIALPPGYNRFLRDRLAVELAMEFRENVPVDPGLMRSATEATANLKRMNTRPMDMAIDAMWTGGHVYNIWADL